MLQATGAPELEVERAVGKDDVMERAGLDPEFESQVPTLSRWPGTSVILKCLIYQVENTGVP